MKIFMASPITAPAGLKLTPASPGVWAVDANAHDRPSSLYWVVECVPVPPKRAIPRGLARHRKALEESTQKSDQLRTRLARTKVAEVTRHQVQQFIDALATDARKPATIGLERAVLRRKTSSTQGGTSTTKTW